jgi:DNA-binding LacI/PurR family transcriptional regulator
MARAATQMLVRRVEHDAPIQQILLPCEPVEGETLGTIHQATDLT